MALCYVLFAMLIAVSSAEPFRMREYDVHEYELKPLYTGERAKRATTTVVGALLITARITFSSEFKREYRKAGGYRQALKDLRALKPRRIESSGVTRWAEVGDRTATLQKDYKGTVTLTLQRKLKNYDGSSSIVTDKIEYF